MLLCGLQKAACSLSSSGWVPLLQFYINFLLSLLSCNSHFGHYSSNFLSMQICPRRELWLQFGGFKNVHVSQSLQPYHISFASSLVPLTFLRLVHCVFQCLQSILACRVFQSFHCFSVFTPSQIAQILCSCGLTPVSCIQGLHEYLFI